MATSLAFIEGLFQPTHVLILLVVGILIFGKRLPDIGRSLGKSIVEFKKGMKGLEDDLDGGHAAVLSPAPPQLPGATVGSEPVVRPPQRVAATAPKFEDAPATVTPPPGTAPRGA